MIATLTVPEAFGWAFAVFSIGFFLIIAITRPQA